MLASFIRFLWVFGCLLLIGASPSPSKSAKMNREKGQRKDKRNMYKGRKKDAFSGWA